MGRTKKSAPELDPKDQTDLDGCPMFDQRTWADYGFFECFSPEDLEALDGLRPSFSAHVRWSNMGHPSGSVWSFGSNSGADFLALPWSKPVPFRRTSLCKGFKEMGFHLAAKMEKQPPPSSRGASNFI
jgi:hypothetical protein